jgi:hypothetical protein
VVGGDETEGDAAEAAETTEEAPPRRDVSSALKNGSEAELSAETSREGEEGRGENCI